MEDFWIKVSIAVNVPTVIVKIDNPMIIQLMTLLLTEISDLK